MKTVGIFKLSLYTVCKENASGKCEQRYQIMQPSLPFTQHKMLAHQYHVSRLCCDLLHVKQMLYQLS